MAAIMQTLLRERGVNGGGLPMATLREWVSRLWGTLRGEAAPIATSRRNCALHLELAAEDARRRGESPERARRARSDRGRRCRAGDGGAARPARPAVARGSGARPALRLPHARDEPRLHRSSPSSRWRSASAPTPPSSALPTRCCSGRSPVPRPGEVLTVGSTDTLQRRSWSASYRDYVDIRDRSKSFEGLVAFTQRRRRRSPPSPARCRN